MTAAGVAYILATLFSSWVAGFGIGVSVAWVRRIKNAA